MLKSGQEGHGPDGVPLASDASRIVIIDSALSNSFQTVSIPTAGVAYARNVELVTVLVVVATFLYVSCYAWTFAPDLNEDS